MKKIGFKIAGMLGLIIALTVGAGALYGTTLLNYSTDAISKTFKTLNNSDEEYDVIEATEPLTILLMGVDMDQATRGGNWEEGRSDSMILLTVNPQTKTTTMMSLTRDIMVEIANGDGTSSGAIEKLNHSYSYGQAEMAVATIEKMMDININRYVEINMDGLVELVDAVGGITVNNTLGFTISIDEYEPAYTATVAPGVQLVNGDQALVYARMRYDDPEGDYGRQKRQREVITAIVKKLLKLEGFTQYKKILDAISNNMRTDIEISTSTIPSLLGYRDSLSTIESYQLTGQDAMIDGISYQIPTSEHVYEMQNILKKSLGLVTVTEVVTNIQVYEEMNWLPSPVTIVDAYTNEIVLEGYGLPVETEASSTSGTETSSSEETTESSSE